MRNIIKNILKEEIDSKSDRVKSIVNRYGIKQSIEMVVGGKDTIRQSYQDNPSEYLNQFNNLIPIEKGDKIYYVDEDGLVLFYYFLDKIKGHVYINYDKIWMFFEKIMRLERYEIEDVINKWLEEMYDIKGLIPQKPYLMPILQLE